MNAYSANYVYKSEMGYTKSIFCIVLCETADIALEMAMKNYPNTSAMFWSIDKANLFNKGVYELSTIRQRTVVVCQGVDSRNP